MTDGYDPVAEVEELRAKLKKARKKAKCWKHKYLNLRDVVNYMNSQENPNNNGDYI